MAAPKRRDPDEFFELLGDVQRPHLEDLRRISLSYAPQVEEALHWNQPAYIRRGERLWMLQAFGGHCSLRFSPAWFEAHQSEVEKAGYAHGAGFLKILYAQDMPEALCRSLIEARIADAE